MKTEVYERRLPASNALHQDSKERRCFRHKGDLEEKETRLRCNGRRYWNHSGISNEDINVVLLRKHDAIAGRERMLKYSYSNRERRNNTLLGELAYEKEFGINTSGLEQWGNKNIDALSLMKEHVFFSHIFSSLVIDLSFYAHCYEDFSQELMLKDSVGVYVFSESDDKGTRFGKQIVCSKCSYTAYTHESLGPTHYDLEKICDYSKQSIPLRIKVSLYEYLCSSDPTLVQTCFEEVEKLVAESVLPLENAWKSCGNALKSRVKHVGVDMAFSILQDLACALIELHSKQFFSYST